MRRSARVQRNRKWNGNEGGSLYENDTQSGNHLSRFQARLFEEEPDADPEDDELADPDAELEDDDSDYEDGDPEDDDSDYEDGDPEDDDSDYEDGELEDDDLDSEDGDPEDDDSDSEDGDPEDDDSDSEDGDPEDDDSDSEDAELEDDDLDSEDAELEDDDLDSEDAELEDDELADADADLEVDELADVDADLEVDELADVDADLESDDLSESDDDLVIEDLPSLDFTWISAKQRVKSQVSDGVLSIVNTAKNGRRISIANKVLQKLGADQFVKLAVKDNQIVITAASSVTGSFQLQPGPKRGVIYSKDLVEHLTEVLGLSFTQKTTVSYSRVSYKTHQSQVIAIIS